MQSARKIASCLCGEAIKHVDRGSPGVAVMQPKVPINMLATLLAIASLVAIILIVEAVKRTSTPSAVIRDAFGRLVEAPD